MRLALRARFCVAVMIGGVGLARPTGEPFAIESSVLVPIDDQTAVSIVGIRGHVTISRG